MFASAPALTNATHVLERLGRLEERMAAQDVKTAQLEASLEKRLVDFARSQLFQNEPVSTDQEAPVEECIEMEAPPEAEEFRSASYDDIKELTIRCDEITLHESAWEAAFVAWNPASGILGSAFLTLAILFNVCAQIVFCTIVYSFFADTDNSTFHDTVIENARDWRLTEAHSTDRMDRATWVSLATRVCGGDGSLVIANEQAGILEELIMYKEPLGMNFVIPVPVGPVLTILCLFLWSFTVASEILRCIDIFNVLLMIPAGGMGSSIVIDADDQIIIKSMGWPRRFALLILTCLRMAIAAWLLVSGGMWLCSTTNLFDLVLNAAALAFVLDFDELIFLTLCPEMVKRTVAQMAPMKRKSDPVFLGLGFRAPVSLLCCIAFVVILYVTILQSVIDRMDLVENEMCNGIQSFVVDSNPSLGYAVAVPTEDIGVIKVSVLADAARELKDLAENKFSDSAKMGRDDQDMLAVVVGSRGDFSTELQRTSADFVTPSCVDEMHNTEDGSAHPAYLETLRSATLLYTATHCENFTAAFCRSLDSRGRWVRSFCGRSCGCNTILSSLVDQSGCPSACTSEILVELSVFSEKDPFGMADCTDKPPAAFRSPPAQRFFEQLQEILDVLLPIENLTDRGCQSLFARTAEEVFGPDMSEWLPDALCGRAKGSNVALESVQYRSMRFLCPVTCGCTLSFSSDCPVSCQKGAYSVQQEACATGLCPGGAVADASPTRGPPGMSCPQIDGMLKSGQLKQATCAILAAQMSFECCCPGGTSCGD
eukprot:TRINITY_DN3138_c0_g1_i5.p1 TRINITY_DN3138_c0_g1~~TRINITY_DN3138_c0_g1_i5.p1  ORF type:complete len:832 (+),score=116.50 TRINITY_DN3138_c0_g1_i5:192-2498(+)